MRRKKAVKIAIYISVVSLFLSGTVASPAYAAGGVQGLAEAETGQKEEKTAEKMAAGNGEETQAESPSEDKDTELESPSEDKDTEPDSPVADKDTEPESPSEDKDAEPDSPSEDKDAEPDSSLEQDVKFSGTTDGKSDDITEKDDGKAADEEKTSEENAEGAEAESAAVRLEVPQKFDIVLDPWEMDGKGQIYSEEYTIKNVSGEKGTLTLTGIVVGEDVNIQPDDSSIYDGDGRNLFIEMVVNEEDRLTLLPEGADYEATLEADEGVTFTFTGKMNETAAAGWRGSDVKVMVIYDWVEESGEDIAEEEKKDPEEEKNLNADVLAESDKEERDTPDTGMSAEDVGVKGDVADVDAPTESGKEEGDTSDTGMSAEDVGVKGDVADVDAPTESGKEEGDTPDTGMSAEDNKGEDTDAGKPAEDVSEKGDADAPTEGSKEEGKDPNVSRPAEDDEGEKDPDVDTLAENGNEEGKVSGVDIPAKDNQEAGEVSGTDTLTEADSKPLDADLPEDSDTKK